MRSEGRFALPAHRLDGAAMADERPNSEMLASMSPEELRSAMRTLGYRTQSDLANAIGVSRSAVSLWLEGKVGVPRPVAMLLRMLVKAQRRAF
jgi:DNA-binding transcriptional regulator YiaG